ncbi:nitrogen regulation protein NR(II) [Candidatus Binatus sp.]|uniref:two-component system sensor histidine kinase NtrB n=1 Tax=Candidatus Binatus sp. TaxID=2811406 RepID=UPI00272BD147|nr:ATP-binding protein [Candidatus Binatus sp.]
MPVIRGRAGRIAIYYIVGGLIWVVISDRVLSLMPAHSITLNRLMFVSVNALLLFVVARRYTRTIKLSHAAGLDAVARARSYFESSVEGIITADTDGLIHQINPRAEELFGYEELELLGKRIEILLPNRLRERHAAHRAEFNANPRSRRMGVGIEIVGRRKDGSEFPIDVSLNAFNTRRGHQVVAFVSDITERRAMEREARRNETLNALGAVAAGIAHELNNPLAVMGARIELMMAPDKELSPETRADLLVLLRNVVRASRISRNMLSLARQPPGVRQPIDINATIADAIQMAGAEERGWPLKIETRFERSLAMISGDATSLGQVIINLVVNAREADAKTVRIETALAPDRPAAITVVIADDGVGMASDTAAKLFEPFFTTKSSGTGLGLWLSQRIIREHGGAIAVESSPGNGTTFVITLPTTEPAPADKVFGKRIEIPAQAHLASQAPAATARKQGN